MWLLSSRLNRSVSEEGTVSLEYAHALGYSERGSVYSMRVELVCGALVLDSILVQRESIWTEELSAIWIISVIDSR